jgi:hypothetical protein
MVDYRKFLEKKEEPLVLPWLGGGSVTAADRRLKVAQRPERRGWYQWVIAGRVATPQRPAEAPSLSDRPAVRGWWSGDALVRDGAVVEPVALLPDEEPARFAPLLARRWHSGQLIFESLEFETEVEDLARQALARQAAFDVKATPAALRAAYGWALLNAVSTRRQIPVVVPEVRAQLARVAMGGAAVADELLTALELERARTRRELAELGREARLALVREDLEHAREQRRGAPVHDARVDAALESAGAALESVRRLGGEQLEVVFEFMGTRFVSVVDARTLQVVDSGICLGHPPRDDLLTLDSLPAVIKEAIDTDALVLLRWP